MSEGVIAQTRTVGAQKPAYPRCVNEVTRGFIVGSYSDTDELLLSLVGGAHGLSCRAALWGKERTDDLCRVRHRRRLRYPLPRRGLIDQWDRRLPTRQKISMRCEPL